MGERKAIQEAHEKSVIESFLGWWKSTTGEDFRIIDRPDPPDAIIQSATRITWLELVDAYRSQEEARAERSLATPGEVPYKRKEPFIVSHDDTIVSVIINNLQNKLRKDSYKAAFETYGMGTLIISERDRLFGDSTLDSLKEECCNCFQDDLGYFETAYLYCCLNRGCCFETIYKRDV